MQHRGGKKNRATWSMEEHVHKVNYLEHTRFGFLWINELRHYYSPKYKVEKENAVETKYTIVVRRLQASRVFKTFSK